MLAIKMKTTKKVKLGAIGKAKSQTAKQMAPTQRLS